MQINTNPNKGFGMSRFSLSLFLMRMRLCGRGLFQEVEDVSRRRAFRRRVSEAGPLRAWKA